MSDTQSEIAFRVGTELLQSIICYRIVNVINTINIVIILKAPVYLPLLSYIVMLEARKYTIKLFTK